MKAKTFALVGAGTLMLAGAANADITGLGFVEVDNTNIGAEIDITIDLYAVVDGPDTFVGAVSNLNINVVGGTFYQDGFGGNTAPDGGFFALVPSLPFDTFLTIQVLDSQNGAAPTFPEEDLLFTDTNISTLAMVPIPPDGAAYAPQMIDGEWRVNIARLSANADGARGDGITFNGTMDLAQTGDSSGDLNGASFDTTPVPAPGALALLGLAGFAGSRRRRK